MSTALPTHCGSCGKEIDPAGGMVRVNGLRPVYHPSCIMAHDFTSLAQRIAKLESALGKIAADTYGTELCNSDAENNEILGAHLVRFQKIARDALAN